MTEMTATRVSYEMPYMPFLRMLAHFDALDGDDDPIAPLPRYELLHPEDFDIPDFTAVFNAQLSREFIYGPAV